MLFALKRRTGFPRELGDRHMASSGHSTVHFNGEEEGQIAGFDEQRNSYCCAAVLCLVMAAKYP